MPDEKYIYFGDNGRAPYGNRPVQEIKKFAFEAFTKLNAFPLKAAVLACNTVTADAADALRASYPFPIVGVEPAIKPAALRGGHVLVLATRATCDSARFKELCARWTGCAQITVFSPESLAGEIEAKIGSLQDVDLTRHLPKIPCDSVVLGCTHYIYLAERISGFYGCPTFDGNAGAAEQLHRLLSEGEKGGGAPFAGTADHLTQKANKCSKKSKKMPEISPFFIGKAKNKNKRVFFSIK